MRLRMVVTADFRMGVPTHVDLLRKKKEWPELSGDEVVLLISQTGLQLAFVFREQNLLGGMKMHTATGVITHVRVQLSRVTPWHPRMLANYAETAGIELVGIKKFQEWYEDEYGMVPDASHHSRGATMRALKRVA